MRTLSQIVIDAKDGNMPTQEECYYAMLVYNFLFIMDHRKLQETLRDNKPSREIIGQMIADSSEKAYYGAFNKSPKDWLGPSNDPLNPIYQQHKKFADKIFEKFMKVR